jgi:hypothetical protein
MNKMLTTQQSIIKQSQLKQSLDYFRSCGHCPNMSELIALTEVFCEYVEKGYTPQVKERFTQVQQYLDKALNTNQHPMNYPIKGSVDFKGE